MIEVKGGTYTAIGSRAAEGLGSTVIDRGVRTDEGRCVVVVNESNTWRMRKGRWHDRKSTAGCWREKGLKWGRKAVVDLVDACGEV